MENWTDPDRAGLPDDHRAAPDRSPPPDARRSVLGAGDGQHAVLAAALPRTSATVDSVVSEVTTVSERSGGTVDDRIHYLPHCRALLLLYHVISVFRCCASQSDGERCIAN